MRDQRMLDEGRAGLRTATFDRGTLVSGVAGYPTYMSFFSTADCSPSSPALLFAGTLIWRFPATTST